MCGGGGDVPAGFCLFSPTASTTMNRRVDWVKWMLDLFFVRVHGGGHRYDMLLLLLGQSSGSGSYHLLGSDGGSAPADLWRSILTRLLTEPHLCRCGSPVSR